MKIKKKMIKMIKIKFQKKLSKIKIIIKIKIKKLN